MGINLFYKSKLYYCQTKSGTSYNMIKKNCTLLMMEMHFNH